MGVTLGAVTSCSDAYMEEVNSDKTKSEIIDPNSQLTTGLLQVYGDFGMMDCVRCYITGFSQHLAGGWNVSAQAGSLHVEQNYMNSVWSSMYNVGLKNVVDAIYNSESKPNVNAILRIHRVYMMSILTDLYGDVPCSEAELGFIKGISNPKYDKQEDIYNWFFEELDVCIKQLGTGNDLVTGDVSAYNGNINKWKKLANSLRMRFAMRISDVNAEKAKQEWNKAVAADCGYIAGIEDNAYIKYIDGPFTLYEGAKKLDFRVNAFSEMMYGQDKTSPTMVCATLYEMLKKNNDPRLYRICRHYNTAKRAEDKVEEVWNLDYTDEVITYQNSNPLPDGETWACVPGAAWYSKSVEPFVNNPRYKTNWVEISDDNIKMFIPALWEKIQEDPEAGFNKSNFQNRMLRPHLNTTLLKCNTPGIIMTSAEVNFLMAEAALKGWDVEKEAKDYFKAGIIESMEQLNKYYDIKQIKSDEFNAYTANNPLSDDPEKAKEQINTEAWILHLTNPWEAWANMRRSDYPYIIDRTRYGINADSNFTYDDPDHMETPTRLYYPAFEKTYNPKAYKEAIDRMGGKDDWHKRVWWDTKDNDHLM